MLRLLQNIRIQINVQLSGAREALVLASDISQGFYGNVKCF